VSVDGVELGAGDAVAVTDETKVVVRGREEKSEVLLFDVA
jgi:hypothetical protein